MEGRIPSKRMTKRQNYHEKATCREGYQLPGFRQKLEKVEDSLRKVEEGSRYLASAERSEYRSVTEYRIGNVVWNSRLKDCGGCVSEFFSRMIMTLVIRPLRPGSKDLYIVNPPPVVSPEITRRLRYVPIHRNELLIINALWLQGSQPTYSAGEHSKPIYYSEHHGTIGVPTNDQPSRVSDILVSIDPGQVHQEDPSVIMPSYATRYLDYGIVFHTHPNTNQGFGRIREGVVYDCPSAQDYLAFCRMHTEGKTQVMIIVSLEGVYVIRPIDYFLPCGADPDRGRSSRLADYLDWCNEIHYQVLEWFRSYAEINSQDEFHRVASGDYRLISLINQRFRSENIWTDYYPREGAQLSLPTIYIPYLAPE